ncbi:hypothetical protein [Streptomyces litchfieldiae]|uniref:Secreted protein n=1 Tax=Streptomyces litchfieldiae TaxID=3075543 RepID=A0ABU2MK94_9ACTN|nr:hypothetical protein [Streptomyces sp. DSM 44938]MDT0342035.1 hypothetical protein [Streptomyces sp. DSM 44938]
MAHTRIVRAVTTLAAVPLLLGVAAGVAQAADQAALASGNVGSLGSGVGDDNLGNSTTTQQSAVGLGNSNESNVANVIGPAFAYIDQSDTAFNFFLVD